MTIKRSAAVEDWDGRHVVVLNWRDLEHPQAGGAEVEPEQVGVHRAELGRAEHADRLQRALWMTFMNDLDFESFSRRKQEEHPDEIRVRYEIPIGS